MRKIAVLFAILSSSAFLFGQDLSFGAGVAWDPYWNSVKETQGDAWAKSETSSPASFDGQIYLDSKYVQVSIGLLETGTYYMVIGSDNSGVIGSIEKSNGNVAGWIYYSAFLKWPFRAGGMTLFPILGAEYDQNIIYTDAGKNDLRAAMTPEELDGLNSFWAKFGMGADIPLSSPLYLRLTLIGNLKFLSQGDLDYEAWLSQLYSSDVTLVYFRFAAGLLFGYRI